MLKPARDYDQLYASFAWDVPDQFNIARAVSMRWAEEDPERICLLHYSETAPPETLTFGALEKQANAIAAGLRSLGIGRGDRIALLLPQGFEAAIAHVAIYKLAAIGVPLALLFGQDALRYRLNACGARAVVTNAMGREKLRALKGDLPGLLHEIVTNSEGGQCEEGHSFQAMLETPVPAPICEETGPETPALMIFTSGTTGPPKGALHGHRVLLGHLPGVQMHHEFFPQPGDRMWTPADWAWAGGLLNVLLPSLYFGVPVVSTPAQKFDPDTAFRIIETLKVRNAFIPPTALRMMRAVDHPSSRYALALRTLASGGEALGRETYEWGRRELGLTINEFYGQTECNLVLSSCAALGVSRAGAIGRPVPGHDVAIIDGAGKVQGPGVPGQIAVKHPDPVMFLEYWNDAEATERKFVDNWMTTGDQGVMDEDGYVSFFGRDDDVITSSGYRIGPGEIEDCLHAHRAVQLAAAVGKPDALRTEVVKVFVVLRPGWSPGDELARELTQWVKSRLSAHEYPREVAFVDQLPLTTTGKVIRRELRERAADGANSRS